MAAASGRSSPRASRTHLRRTYEKKAPRTHVTLQREIPSSAAVTGEETARYNRKHQKRVLHMALYDARLEHCGAIEATREREREARARPTDTRFESKSTHSKHPNINKNITKQGRYGRARRQEARKTIIAVPRFSHLTHVHFLCPISVSCFNVDAKSRVGKRGCCSLR